MSLLDKATIITTPTAHSEGKLHSIKGGSVADFDVVRGSAATRVNAEGLIEDIRVIGDEEILNGDFSNGSTDWALADEWSIGTNKAIYDNSSSGNLIQNFTWQVGKTYKITFDIGDFTTNQRFDIYSGVSFIKTATTEDNTSYTIYFNGDGGSTFRFRGLTTEGFSITNISIKEVIDATNIPRIDYTGGTASILLEPQSTNLVTYSEDFSNASWTKVESTVTGGFTSPDGTSNAYKLIASVNNSNHRLRSAVTPTGAVGTSVTFSVFCKPEEITKIAFADNWTNLTYSAVDLTTNSVIESALVTTNITELFNGFVRISFNYLTSNINTLPAIYLLDDGYVSGNPTAYTFSGNGADGVLIYGIQLEALSHATSYIPTSGAIATRLADLVTGAGDASTFNSTEGVLYAEMAALADDGAIRYITISDGTVNNILSITFFNNSTITSRITIGGTNTYLVSGVITQTDNFKVALKWGLNNYALWVNGVEVDSNNLLGVFAPDTMSTLDFKRASALFFGKVKSVITFDTALTDAELECLTTI